MTELKHYGMHRHFTGAGSVLMFGGGIKKGLPLRQDRRRAPLHDDRRDPVTVSDLHATIYRTLGISPKYGVEIEQRPFYVTKDGKGQPVLDVLRA